MSNNSADDLPRLHLGCGQRYLKGYVNIDFPLDNHSVQTKSVADIQTDITGLVYPARSVAEVRLHHVFEHFRRPAAAALLAIWNQWLIEGGQLHIEVPDLRGSAITLVNPFASFRRKAVAERHLFGSHEASWAAHYEAYSADLLENMVRAFGFAPKRRRYTSWRGIHNIEVIAVKKYSLKMEECRHAARGYLSSFLVNTTPDELMLLETWMKMFDTQMVRGVEMAGDTGSPFSSMQR